MKEPIEQLEEWLILQIEGMRESTGVGYARAQGSVYAYTKTLEELRAFRIEARKPS